jgi:hypothetical protein
VILVNHGAPVRTVFRSGRDWELWEVEHDGPDGHRFLVDGEQCECGVLPIGVILRPGTES